MKFNLKIKAPKINLYILKVILLLKGFYKKWNIDVVALEILLRTKLTIDERKPLNPFMGNQIRSKPSSKNSNWVQTLVFLVFGVFYASILFVSESKNLGFYIFFAGMMATVLLSTLMEFSHILMDEKDTYIIFPKPINDETLLFSRYLHMIIYVLKLSFTFSIPVIVYAFIGIGILSGILLIVQVAWLSLLLVLLVCILYLFIFKMKDVGKIKNLLAKGQIIITIIFVSQFYIIPYFTKAANYIQKFELKDTPILGIVPSSWISVWQDILISHQFNGVTLSIAMVSLMISFSAFILFVKYLSPKFNQSISALSFSSTENKPSELTPLNTSKSTILWSFKLSHWLTNNDIEKSTFRVIWSLTNRYNEFKMRFYPSFGFLLVYFIYLFLNMDGTFNDKIDNLRGRQEISLFVIYYCGVILNGAFGQLSVSSKYKASWIYHIAPVEEAGQILSGAYKAILSKYLIPIYFFIACISTYIFGVSIINDFILGFIMLNIIAIITNIFMYNTLPFSAPVNYYKSKWYLGFALLFVQLIFAGIHYLMFRWETVVWGAIPLLSIALFFMLRSYKKQKWSELKIYEGE